jgi:alkyl sulfatase BDS1-like metallo-beta-lactamase superfamily hydrolase
MGAKELRDGIVDTPTVSASPEMVGQVPLEQILDGMAFRIDGPRAFGVELSIVFELSDTGEAHTLTLENAVLTHTPGKREDAQAALRLPRPALDELIAETVTTAELFEAGRIAIEGDGAKVGELFGLMDEPDPGFPIVTP